jgi:hypothetical protein
VSKFFDEHGNIATAQFLHSMIFTFPVEVGFNVSKHRYKLNTKGTFFKKSGLMDRRLCN